MAKATQDHRHLAVGTPLGDDVLLVRAFSGSEAFSRPFEFDLELLSEDHAVKGADLLGKNISVRVEHPGDATRYFNGYVNRFSQVPGPGRYARYRATLVPWLWFLTRSADCRIFQDQTVPEIIKKVFEDHGFTDFKDELSGSYNPRTYCVQYRETAFNFVSRLMEHEGIYYCFAHENGKHMLRLCDAPAAHSPVEGYEEIPFREASAVGEREAIRTWLVEHQYHSGACALTDYDFTQPTKDLRVQAKTTREDGSDKLEVFDYPGEHSTADGGETYAKIRLEELESTLIVVSGRTDARGLTVGSTFTLTDHPREDQAGDYLVTASSYSFSNDQYEGVSGGAGVQGAIDFTAIPADRPFRAPRTTHRTRVAGPQTAVVVGPSGEEIYTDEHGRVKVMFHWDRYAAADENSSCWIRVAQVWAGKNWGGMYIPRIGQEVVVDFLEGDPDQPLITGRVYNGSNKTPYTLPDMATISGLKSNSSKGGGGFNEIRLEDKKGEEQLFIHAEKNQDTRVKNDAFEWIGHDRHLIVKNDQVESVENNRSEKIGADHMEEIGKDRHLKVTGKEAKEVGGSQSLTVKADVIEVFKANHSETVTQNLYLKAMGIVIEATTGITLKCGGNAVVIDAAGVTVKGTMVTLDGSMTKINSGPGSSAASGSAGSAVAPAVPAAAEEADTADPGEIEEVKAEQREMGKGKYGSTKVKPYKKDPEKTGWIEIELLDEAGHPVPGERYLVTLPDGQTAAAGTLDDKGFARVDGIDPGTCKITFPRLDKDAWKPS